MDVDEEANLKSRMLDSAMSTAAYDPSMPLPALCDIDDGNPEPLPEMSDDGEIFSEDDNNSNHSSQCDFYIESDADLLRLREVALESARARRAESAAATIAANTYTSSIPTVCVDKDLEQKQDKEDDDMDIVDSPLSPMPDTDMDAAMMMDVELLSANPDLQKIVDEVKDGEMNSASSHSGEQNLLSDDVSDELARIADLAEWVVVDECEEALESIKEAVTEDEEPNTDVNTEDADDEEELLALREILISNLRARVSAKSEARTVGSSSSVQESHNVGFDTPVIDNAELDQAADPETKSASPKVAVEESMPSDIRPESVLNEPTQQLMTEQSIPISMPESVISKPANTEETAKVEFDLETNAEVYVHAGVAEDPIQSHTPVLSSVASAPNLTISSASKSQTSNQRRFVVGLSSVELRDRNKSVSQNSNSNNTGSASSVSRRFVICVGDTSSSESSESESKDEQQPPPPAIVVDDRARLQSLRHSVRAGASKLRAGLAADRQELQQRQAKLTERFAELAEKRTAAIRLRQDTKRALELCAQLRKRSLAADAELRRLELIAAKEQRTLRARQTAFRARESRVLAALNESNLLRRVCPPTPSTMSGGPLDPFIPLCPFGLHGSCRDPACEYQHLIDWRQPEHANRGRPNPAANSIASSASASTPAMVPTTVAFPVPSTTASTIHRRLASNNNNNNGSVSLKDFCDACDKYVTVGGAHLRDDPRCDSCQSAVETPEQAIAVLHHFLCRLRIRQSNSSDSRDCVAAAEAFANRITGQYPNHVGLVLHSLELRRLAKRPVPVALLKTLLNRVPNCGIVRRAIRLQSDYSSQRQLLEFAFALPELLNSADSLDLLQLALSHCRLMYLASTSIDNDACLQQIWPTGPPLSMSKSHAAFLQLCRLYWIVTGEPPDLPTNSLSSDAALLAELPIFFELKATRLVTGLRQILVAAGIFQSVTADNDETGDDDSDEDRFKPEALTASLCDWLIGSEPICPFRHCLILLIARCLANKFGANLNGLSAVYRLLAIRRAFLPALSDWLTTVGADSTAGSLSELLRSCGAASVNHWPDLAHSAVRWRLENWPIEASSKKDEIESLLSVAIFACYTDRPKLEEELKGSENNSLLYYRHMLGLLSTDETLHCQLSTPIRTVSVMDPEAQLAVVLNYVQLLKQKNLLDASAMLSLISLTSRLSPRAGINILRHLATIAANNSWSTINALCRKLKSLLRTPCPASLATAAARFVDAIDWKELNNNNSHSDDQNDDSATFSAPTELIAMANRVPYCLPLLQSVCNELAACNCVQDACALCLDSARFHQPTNPKFWLELALGLVQAVHPGAIRPQLDLLERGLQLIPLCRQLWLTAIQLADCNQLKRTADRLKNGMNSRLNYCGVFINADISSTGSTIAATSKSASA